jgi:hypothetical protein
MKRMIAGVLLLIGLGAGTMFAEDGYWRDRRDIRRDEVRIAHNRRELRRTTRARGTNEKSYGASIAT